MTANLRGGLNCALISLAALVFFGAPDSRVSWFQWKHEHLARVWVFPQLPWSSSTTPHFGGPVVILVTHLRGIPIGWRALPALCGRSGA